jgi:8-oxo-dGTP pyrophosphatase MutT (NUDIX family)
MRPLRNCAKAIIIRDQHILSVKYADEGGEYYALPGGGQLHGETLPEALLRECHEELGATVKNKGLRFIREYIGKDGDSSWRDAGVHQVEFLYECELAAGQEPIGGSHWDHSQVGLVWLPIESIKAYRFYPRKLVEYLGRPLPDRIEYWGKAA